jgi:hypothetical protein
VFQPDREALGPWLRLRGTASVLAALADRATQAPTRHAFDLELPANRAIRVEVDDRTRIVHEAGVDPVTALRVGAAVEVLGDVQAVFAEPRGDLRQAPSRQLALRARVVAIGPAPASQMDRAIRELERALVVGRNWLRGLWPWGLVLVPAVLFLAIHGANWVGISPVPVLYLMPSDCGKLVQAAIVESPAPALVLQASCHVGRTGWATRMHRLAALSLGDGAVLGHRVQRAGLEWIGLTPGEVWLAGGGRAEGFALPALDRRHRLSRLLERHPELEGIVKSVAVDGLGGRLRLWARDGREYRLTLDGDRLERLPIDPPSPAPTLLAPWAACEWRVPGRVYEARGCRPMEIDGEPITIERRLTSGGEQVVVARRRADGRPRWERSERELFDGAGPHRLLFAARHEGRIAIVATEREPDDLHAVAIDARSGALLWSRTFW